MEKVTRKEMVYKVWVANSKCHAHDILYKKNLLTCMCTHVNPWARTLSPDVLENLDQDLLSYSNSHFSKK